jgi:hypothetical protein
VLFDDSHITAITRQYDVDSALMPITGTKADESCAEFP